MVKNSHLLFVYGTLQSNRPAHALMRLRNAEYLGEAVLHGYALYDLDYYPGIVPEMGERVLGEVYRVDDKALVTLDKYENEGTLFNRQVADISIRDNGEVKAFIYVYSKSVETRRKIPADQQPWGERKNEMNKDFVWYACYGSNLSRDMFVTRYINQCVDTTPPQEDKPYILYHELYFAGSSGRWDQKGVAFVTAAPKEKALTYGRAYRITRSQLDEIQKLEGGSVRWYGNQLHLGVLDGLPVYTLTRDAAFDFTTARLPSAQYVDIIRQGLEEVYPELDAEAYLERIQEFTKSLISNIQ